MGIWYRYERNMQIIKMMFSKNLMTQEHIMLNKKQRCSSHMVPVILKNVYVYVFDRQLTSGIEKQVGKERKKNLELRVKMLVIS